MTDTFLKFGQIPPTNISPHFRQLSIRLKVILSLKTAQNSSICNDKQGKARAPLSLGGYSKPSGGLPPIKM